MYTTWTLVREIRGGRDEGGRVLGLRSNSRFAGATRLLDEWLTGLEPFWAEGPRVVDDALAATLFGGAAARVRKFARRGGLLEPVLPDEDALMRFELQGYDYLARALCFAPRSVPELGLAPARLREGLAALRAHLGSEEQGVFALVIAPSSAPPIDPRDWVSAVLALELSGLAWAFPDARDPFGQQGVTSERPGLALALAWSEDPRFA